MTPAIYRGCRKRAVSGRQGRSPRWLLVFALTAAVLVGAPCGSCASKSRIQFYVDPVKFAGARLGAKRPGLVMLMNMMTVDVTVKVVSLEGGSEALKQPGGAVGPFVLSPGERLGIPVEVIAREGSGSARLRVVAAPLNSEAVVVEVVKFHYEIEKERK